jgi:hypothetical protein
MALKEDFSYLFGIACLKDAFVVAPFEFLGGYTKWNVNFVRTAHD